MECAIATHAFGFRGDSFGYRLAGPFASRPTGGNVIGPPSRSRERPGNNLRMSRPMSGSANATAAMTTANTPMRNASDDGSFALAGTGSMAFGFGELRRPAASVDEPGLGGIGTSDGSIGAGACACAAAVVGAIAFVFKGVRGCPAGRA